jgi:hypothetical protein
MTKEDGRDFPFIDDGGNTWLDAYGIKAPIAVPCIICRRQTHRIDINFLSFLCNAPACRKDARYLALRNGYNGEYDEEYWTNEPCPGGSL